MTQAQTFPVAISPAQRFLIFNMTHGEKTELRIANADDGIRYRRFVNALAIKPISETVREYNSLLVKHVNDEKPSVFPLTIENVEFGLKLQALGRSPLQEEILGPLFDTFAQIKNAPDTYKIADGVPEFDAEADAKAWVPVPGGGLGGAPSPTPPQG